MKAWGPVLRIACWNIERGFNFDLIRLAFSDAEGFQQTALEHGALDPEKTARNSKTATVSARRGRHRAERGGLRDEADRLSRCRERTRARPEHELCVRSGVRGSRQTRRSWNRLLCNWKIPSWQSRCRRS